MNLPLDVVKQRLQVITPPHTLPSLADISRNSQRCSRTSAVIALYLKTVSCMDLHAMQPAVPLVRSMMLGPMD